MRVVPPKLRSLIGRALDRLAEQPSPVPPAPHVPDGWTCGPPDFVGVGVQRAGTTRWLELILTHPRVSRATGLPKELHFFDALYAGSVPGDLAGQYARYFPRAPGTITGEWSPRYMFNPWTMPLLREVAPDARLLISLRDPVDRYVSAIGRAVRNERRGGRRMLPSRAENAAAKSLYTTQLERVFRHFPREQVLILQYEQCSKEPERELERTWEFLGLEPAPMPSAEQFLERQNPAAPAPVSGEVTEALVDYLAPDMARLVDLVPEIDLSLWPSWTRAAGALAKESGP